MNIHSALGFVAFLILCWLLSENRRTIVWRTVVAGVVLQLALVLVLLHVPALRDALFSLNGALQALQQATQAGTSFVFGYLAGGDPPYAEVKPHAAFILAFRALPLVLVVSALSALLYHWRVLPAAVKGFAWLLQKTMAIGGAVGVSSAANVFVGMVEAPLFVRPYLAQLTRGELFIVMTCGMATIAGTVMAVYGVMLASVVPDAIGHILVASLVATPAAITVAALMVPSPLATVGEVEMPSRASSTMDAVAKGAVEGVELLINVAAMLIVLVALIALANIVLALLPDVLGAPVTLQRMLGALLASLAWLTGIPWDEAPAAGALLGTKVVLNEFVAYADLARLPATELSDRSRLLMVYALCGFANFGSLGIMIGGMGTMVPQRRAEIAELGLKSIVAGTLATCMTAAAVGTFL